MTKVYNLASASIVTENPHRYKLFFAKNKYFTFPVFVSYYKLVTICYSYFQWNKNPISCGFAQNKKGFPLCEQGRNPSGSTVLPVISDGFIAPDVSLNVTLRAISAVIIPLLGQAVFFNHLYNFPVGIQLAAIPLPIVFAARRKSRDG